MGDLEAEPLGSITQKELHDFHSYSMDLFEASDNRVFAAKTVDANEYAM